MTAEELVEIKRTFDAECESLANDPDVRSSAASELQACFDLVWDELLAMRAELKRPEQPNMQSAKWNPPPRTNVEPPPFTMRTCEMPESDKSCEVTAPDLNAVVGLQEGRWMHRRSKMEQLADDPSLTWVVFRSLSDGVLALVTDEVKESGKLQSLPPSFVWPRDKFLALWRDGLVDGHGVAVEKPPLTRPRDTPR